MVVTIHSVTTLQNSVNGNPRYKLFTSEGTFKTKSDAMYAYAIHSGYEGKQALITLTKSGNIESIDLMKS